MYGPGAYFADDTAYSHNGYKHTSTDGTYQMFVSRVCTGRVDERAVPDSSIRHPKHGYNCVRGPVQGAHHAYIVYEPFLCYPEYLVSYTTP